MNISIFGLGYVGAVSAGCLTNDGNHVIGVDSNSTKVELIIQGRSPIIEQNLDEYIHNGIRSGKLTATSNVFDAIAQTEMSFVCVGTPSLENGKLDLTYIQRVCKEIGTALGRKSGFHAVVVRSTVFPGTVEHVLIPLLEEYSQKRSGDDFAVAMHPEFMREGSAVSDYYHPAKTIVGETGSTIGDVIESLYSDMDVQLVRTDIKTSEIIKYIDNTWHALKITYANEIGKLCKALSMDSHEVMDIFCHDTKLNISKAYLKPGFAFGGSCLPKDLRALLYQAKGLDLELPVIDSVLTSNALQVDYGVKMILGTENRKIGIMGISFKEGTDDLRESPMVEVVERLLGKGCDIRIFDRNVNLAKLIGANREFILNRIPHISKLLVERPDDVLNHSKTIVIGNNSPEIRDILDRVKPSQIVIDFVRIHSSQSIHGVYDGISW